jgi:hypothetical protein
VTDVTALTTLRTLVDRVFSVFGTPAVMVTDNGPAFVSDLTAAASKFYGYRHIHVLPYNAPANGTAEAAVKRIKLLLDRQCKNYTNWHRLIPLAQQLLNSTVHTGTGVSPFMALFGREPIGLECLENPALYPSDDGHEFLSELRTRLISLHAALRQQSDALKQAHADAANARLRASATNTRHGTVLASTGTVARYVWILYGSAEQARHLRKYGHGQPWKHKYKVLEVKPHAVRLEIPSDGSVPRINEWQLIRRVHPAREDEHVPPDSSPALTELGIPVPRMTDSTTPLVVTGSPDADDTDYAIDHVSHAEKVGSAYKIWLKWTGFADLGWRWRHELVRETSNPELLEEVDKAVVDARERWRVERGRLTPDDDDDDDVIEPTRSAPSVPMIPIGEEPALPSGRTRAKFTAPPLTLLSAQVDDTISTRLAASVLLADTQCSVLRHVLRFCEITRSGVE